MDRLQEMAKVAAEVVMKDLGGRKGVLDDLDGDMLEEIEEELRDQIAEALKCPTCNGSGMEPNNYSSGPDADPPSSCRDCQGTGVHL